jgi:hypothetical protein
MARAKQTQRKMKVVLKTLKDHVIGYRKIAHSKQMSLLMDKHPEIVRKKIDTLRGFKINYEMNLWETMWDKAFEGIIMEPKKAHKLGRHLMKLSQSLLFRDHFPDYPEIKKDMNESETIEDIDWLRYYELIKKDTICGMVVHVGHRCLLPCDHLLRLNREKNKVHLTLVDDVFVPSRKLCKCDK